MSIETQVTNVLSNYLDRFDIEGKIELKPEVELHELDLDSLDYVELTMELEEEFDIEIPDSDVDKFSTLQSVIDIVKSKIKPKFYWLSWNQKEQVDIIPSDTGILGYWESGESEDSYQYVAMVKAHTDDEAQALIYKNYTPTSIRFSTQKETPTVSDRFPVSAWMVKRGLKRG